jgi:hypothetical protein
VTPAERKELLSAELDRARWELTPTLRTFVKFCEEDPPPDARALKEAADEIYLKVGRVALFAELLTREDDAAAPGGGSR